MMYLVEPILTAMKKEMKIYILDDNEYFGTMLKESLSNKNRIVKCFQSEIEFIRRLKDMPDIIILDHTLEHCTGLEVLEVIKRKCGPVPNVIYLSAQEHLTVTLKALRNGAVEYIEKGLTPLEYVENIISKISKHTSHFETPLNLTNYRSDSTVY